VPKTSKPSPHERTWNKRISQLKAYKRKHGNSNVPGQYAKNQALATWVKNVRMAKKHKTLAKQRIRELDAMGFVWSLRVRSVRRYDWEPMLAALVAFKKRYGHCNVFYEWNKPPGLGRWLRSARRRQKNGSLDPAQARQLEEVGGTRESQWQEMYSALVEYKKEHGDCEVFSDRPEDQELAKWVRKQWPLRLKNALSEDRIKQLDKIGFIWESVRKRRWERMYSALVEYKNKHGNSTVHPDSPEHRKLARWVHHQRRLRRSRLLGKRHQGKLDILGFDWGAPQGQQRQPWEEILEELIQYKEQYGTCDVSVTSKKHAKLARFVLRQKMAKRDGTLPKDREKRLKEIGFRWSMRAPKKKPTPKKPRSTQYGRWTEKELTFLREHWHTMTTSVLAKKLDRSPGAVANKASELGLSRRSSWFTKNAKA